MTEDSSFHGQPSLDTSSPKRPGTRILKFVCVFGQDGSREPQDLPMIPKRPGAWVLSSFVFLDTTPFVSINGKDNVGSTGTATDAHLGFLLIHHVRAVNRLT